MVDFDGHLWAAVCQLYPDCYNAQIGEIALGTELNTIQITTSMTLHGDITFAISCGNPCVYSFLKLRS